VLSRGLPHGFVRELHYNAEQDVVVAAILGRGAWTLTGFFQGDRRDLIARQGARSPLSRAAVGGFHQDLPGVPPVAVPAPLED